MFHSLVSLSISSFVIWDQFSLPRRLAPNLFFDINIIFLLFKKIYIERKEVIKLIWVAIYLNDLAV